MLTFMSDREAVELLTLLAQYAHAFGHDTAQSITVKELADDLVDSMTGYTPASVPGELRDRIYDGLNQ